MKSALYILIFFILAIFAYSDNYNITYFCYQEYFNVSTFCADLNNGTYTNTSASATQGLAFDGDYSTSMSTWGGTYIHLNLSYQIPYNAMSAIFQVKDAQGLRNYTLNSSCFNMTTLRLNISMKFSSTQNNQYYCANTSGENALFYDRSDGSPALFEEAIFWQYINQSRYINVNILSSNGGYIDYPVTQYYTYPNTQYSSTHTIDKLNYGWNTLEHIYVKDNDDSHFSKNITYNITYFTSEINITLISSYMYLNFSSGADVFVRYNYSAYNYSNIHNYTINISMAYNESVKVEYRKTGTQNSYQIYDFPYELFKDSNLFGFITYNFTNIRVLDNTETEFCVQVIDMGGTKQPNVLLIVEELQQTSGIMFYREINRILTDPDGYASMHITYGTFLRIFALRTGFPPQTFKVNQENLKSNLSCTTPYRIKLSQEADDVIGWGSMFPTYFWERNITISGYVEYFVNKEVRFETDYMRTLGLQKERAQNTKSLFSILNKSILYMASNTYYIDLLPNQHYNGSGDSNITIYIYIGEDEELKEIRQINYLDIQPTVIANISEKLSGTTGYNIFLFFALIMISVIFQFLFKTEIDNVGVYTFLVGGIFISLFSYVFWVFSVICFSFFILKSVKLMIGSVE